ncbi:Hypothetical protein NTJ_14009 [Nesidiocoris tenuis]|uniref:DUF4371 domain-containing protein n=1 Tax=Nesidiocoris tenuis TaxID=355587 RepID=A0ABN7BBZ1_9HEMI|nr:Hypothetical protein NTJ_14009 [Nesidiocoris tenuis]
MDSRVNRRYPGAEDCPLEDCFEVCFEQNDALDSDLEVTDLPGPSTEIVDLTDDTEATSQEANSAIATTDFGSSTNSCPIKRLFAKRFSWTEVERMEFIRNGRPCPVVSRVIDGKPLDLKEFTAVQWLTGSNDLGQVFCWPCLLFNRPGHSVWAKKGFSSLNTLVVAVRRHEMDQEHMEAVLRLNLAEIDIEQELIVVETNKIEDAQREEQVKLYRSMVRQLMGIIALPKIGHCIDIFESPDKQAHLLNFLTSINGPFKTYRSANKNVESDLASFLVKSTPDLLQAIVHCARARLKEEVSLSSYVTLIIEDTAAVVSESSYLSFVVRFVCSNSKTYEHFIRFVKVGEERTATDLLKHVQSVLTELNCVKSLVGFTYDGAALAPDEIQKFNCGVKLITPQAVFFHYRSHSVQRILMQALSHSKSSRHLFEKLDDLYRFFKNIPNILEMVDEMRKKAGQNAFPVLDFSSEFVVTLNQNYQIMSRCCEIVSQKPENWNNTTSDRARRCLVFLSDVYNKHAIALLATILTSVRGFAAAAATSNLSAWKSQGEKAISMLEQLTKVSELQVDHDETRSSTMRRELIDCAKSFISERTKNISDLAHYGYLMTLSSGVDFEREIQTYPAFENFLSSRFDSQAVIAQIGFVYSNGALAGKPIEKMMAILHDYDLLEDFADLAKYLRLLLTVPILTLSATESPREKIALWTQTTSRATDFTRDDSFLFIEKKLIAELRKSEQFCDSVIKLFASKTNRKEFL